LVTVNQLEQHRLKAIIQSQRQARRLSYGMVPAEGDWLTSAIGFKSVQTLHFISAVSGARSRRTSSFASVLWTHGFATPARRQDGTMPVLPEAPSK
jgi:hypothetical protein